MLRICSVQRLQDMEDTFGKPYNWISQVFNYFVIWMKRTHGWRLHANLSYWMPHLSRFSEAIRVKLTEISDGVLNYEAHAFKVCCVVDCCNQVIRRPGTGPIADGPNVPRADEAGWIQRVFYNGWLGDCGIKYGTVEAPCGMTMYASSGESSRHSDLQWLVDSNINGMFEDVQRANNINPNNFYKMYGDSIFPWMSCLLSRYRGENVSDIELLENRKMSSCRQHVEWHYGEIKMMFPFVDYENKQQLLKCPVTETFVTAMLLRNCHVCLNENKTSKYFSCSPPSLENYLL
jgi:DDE superfamily endonuclease